MRSTRLVCAIPLLLAACTGTPMPSDAGTDADTARCPLLDEATAFDRAIDRARCEQRVACASDLETNTEYDCIELARLGDRAWLCDALASGERTFHPEAASACLAATEAAGRAPCRGPAYRDADARARAACDAVWTDRPVARDPECRADYECGFTQPCVARATCGGECLARRGLGETCDEVFRCDVGMYCDDLTRRCSDTCGAPLFSCLFATFDWNPIACVGGHCRPVSGLVAGDACLTTDDGQRVCPGGLHCSVRGLCATPAPGGAGCDPLDGSYGCSWPYRCDWTTHVCLDTTGECAVRDGQVLGCDGTYPYCGRDFICTDDATRQQCQPYRSSDTCPDGYVCVRSGTYPSGCNGTTQVGETCDGAFPCVDGSTCSGGRCVPVVVPWEPCGPAAICPRGMDCVDAACVARPPTYAVDLGQGCDANHACWEGACVAGTCAWRAPGEPCVSARECPNGCSDGSCRDYLVVGQDETCGDGTRICETGLLCLTVVTEPGQPAADHCRPACTP